MRTLKLILTKFPKWIAWLFIILDFIWELPQNLAGILVKLVFIKYGDRRVRTVKDGDCTIQNWSLWSGVSLGWFQFTNEKADAITASHEIGHSYQSLYLGPLYLLIIGIPSILWAGIFHKYFFKDKSYYSFFTESWADSLAEIRRR